MHPWAMIPTFELGRDLCTMHLPLKFHHPMFTRSEVIVLTNKHTDKTNAAENDVGYIFLFDKSFSWLLYCDIMYRVL